MYCAVQIHKVTFIQIQKVLVTVLWYICSEHISWVELVPDMKGERYWVEQYSSEVPG